jgi:proteasome lid subunit RPN8/RPN11
MRCIHIPSADMEKMRWDVDGRAPEEACGMLAGRFEQDCARSMAVLPTANSLHSPVKYQIDPLEQYKAFIWIESQEMELVGIYHSHPHGPESPSRTDIAESYYPGVAYLIWSGKSGEWECRAFLIEDGKVSSLDLLVIKPE